MDFNNKLILAQLVTRCHLDQRFGLNNMNSSQKDQMIYFRIVLLDNLKSYIYQKKKKKKKKFGRPCQYFFCVTEKGVLLKSRE